jgi:DNA-binding transcriptional ArsR family regulator
MEFRDALHDAYAPDLAALDVLDQPTRRLIIGLIAREPSTVSRLCRLLGLSQPLVSKHVRVLLDAGLVTAVSRTGFRGDLDSRMLSWGEEILSRHGQTTEVSAGAA